MEQLPPKIPHMATHYWPSFPHQRMSFIANHHHTNAAANTMAINNTNNQHPSLVDEFLDFSSVRRGAHRLSISDSIAFLHPPSFVEDCRNNISNGMTNNTPETFDRLDNEQLMLMFFDGISMAVPPPASSSNPSTPSDQNSNNDDKTTHLDQQVQQPKNEQGEVDSSSKSEAQDTQTPSASNGDTIIDPKRVKRILANRQSAQRSRLRKLQYISVLEKSVTTLQTEVLALSPRVAFLDHQRMILNVDNSALKKRIAALAQDKIFKDAHQEALKKEIKRLRQVYHQQILKKMNNSPRPLASAVPPQQPPMNVDAIGCTDKDNNFSVEN